MSQKTMETVVSNLCAAVDYWKQEAQRYKSLYEEKGGFVRTDNSTESLFEEAEIVVVTEIKLLTNKS